MGKNSPGYNDVRRARYAERKAAKLAPIADKRLEGVLKIHGATQEQASAIVKKRREAIKASEIVAVKPPKPKFDFSTRTMARSTQRAGKVAGGLPVRGGGQQLTVTLTQAQMSFLSKLAASNGVSMSEAVRKCVDVAAS